MALRLLFNVKDACALVVGLFVLALEGCLVSLDDIANDGVCQRVFSVLAGHIFEISALEPLGLGEHFVEIIDGKRMLCCFVCLRRFTWDHRSRQLLGFRLSLVVRLAWLLLTAASDSSVPSPDCLGDISCLPCASESDVACNFGGVPAPVVVTRSKKMQVPSNIVRTGEDLSGPAAAVLQTFPLAEPIQ
eukprot:3668420-Amphidinium_carterae.2